MWVGTVVVAQARFGFQGNQVLDRIYLVSCRGVVQGSCAIQYKPRERFGCAWGVHMQQMQKSVSDGSMA